MASGRSTEVAKRNANIKRRRARGESIPSLVERYGISRQKIHAIIANPNSDKVTVRTPAQVVRPLDPPTGRKYKGITHGTEAGYREELRRGIQTCDDCREAHAVVTARYIERRAAREAAASPQGRRSRRTA
jgi:hypothetical protein